MVKKSGRLLILASVESTGKCGPNQSAAAGDDGRAVGEAELIVALRGWGGWG